jgi:hypothetical protein
MPKDLLAYLIFGFSLVALFVWIIFHYYSKKRHEKVESIKYKILQDDDE